MSEQLPAPSNGALPPPNLPDGRVDTELYVPAGAIPTATPTTTAIATAPLNTANRDVQMMDISLDQPCVRPPSNQSHPHHPNPMKRSEFPREKQPPSPHLNPFNRNLPWLATPLSLQLLTRQFIPTATIPTTNRSPRRRQPTISALRSPQQRTLPRARPHRHPDA